MKKSIKPPRLVTVAVFTTITIIFWIFFSVYRILTSPVDVQVDPELLQPINPTLNTEILNTVESNLYYDSSNIDTSVYDAPAPQNTPEETEEAVEESQPTEAPAQDEDETSTEIIQPTTPASEGGSETEDQQ